MTTHLPPAPRRAAAAALLLALAACGHSRPSGAFPFWPAQPEAPRVRWAGVVPPDHREVSRFRRVLHAVVGLDPDRPEAPLARPFGVAVAGDRLLVLDPDAPQVLRADWRGGTSERVECRGRGWEGPMAAAVAPDGTLFVADASLHAIVRIGAGGACALLGEGALERPTGIALAAGRLYVADPPRHQVVVFTPDGEEVLRFGQHGDRPGELNFPTAVAAAPDGTLLVVDALHFRVARFAPDGRFLSSFGAPGDEGGALARPKGVAVDGAGEIYVTDALRDALLVFSPRGELLLPVGGTGRRRGEFLLPAGVAVDGRFVFVADSLNRRVQVLELLGGTP